MAKAKNSTIFRCAECGATQVKWLGRCPECGSWNSFVEVAAQQNAARPFGKPASSKASPVALSAVKAMEGERVSTGSQEFDRVLGGGATLRSAILIGGEPGIGKSTLLLQTAAAAAARGISVLYASGEESASQIRSRADRLGLDCAGISVLCATALSDIEDALRSQNPKVAVIDSVQTVFSADAGNVPGTISQLKLCAYELVAWVKERDAALFMTAHITKEGAIAGPKSLEHIVDTVISFESAGDETRILRSLKNRFGSTDELGVFSMGEKGLRAVEDPSAMFITNRKELPAGIAIAPVYEGSRVFLVEIQALTIPTKTAISRVTSERIEAARVLRVAAILEKRLGIRLCDQDIFVNVAGGVRLSESAIDLALAAAIYSARVDLPCPQGVALAGELSLAGEVRPVRHLKQRVKTARELGFSKVVSAEKTEGAEAISSVQDLARTLFAAQ